MSEWVKEVIEELEGAMKETDRRLDEVLDEISRLPNALEQTSGVDREIQERLQATLDEVMSQLRRAAEQGKESCASSFKREIDALSDYLGR